MADIAVQLGEALRDRYLLERKLGQGGMATVYLVRDIKHDRLVALKVLHPELATSLGPERFQREVRTVARLQHPHILTVLDSGEASGQLWFTMPYVEGESLRDRLRREGQLPVEDAVRIAIEAARGLDCAHQHGIVHRDVKPENILLTNDCSTLVADFGLARALGDADDTLTQTGMVLGTPMYMSPEQASGGLVDARTDVYALGCVLYEMLTGEPPFIGSTPLAITAKRLAGEAPRVRLLRSAVPPAIDAAIARAVAPVPADRFGSMAELARALGEHGPAPVVPAASHRRRRAATIGFVLVGCCSPWPESLLRCASWSPVSHWSGRAPSCGVTSWSWPTSPTMRTTAPSPRPSPRRSGWTSRSHGWCDSPARGGCGERSGGCNGSRRRR